MDVRLVQSRYLHRYVTGDESSSDTWLPAMPDTPGDRFTTVLTQYKRGAHEPWQWALSGGSKDTPTERYQPDASAAERAPRRLADPQAASAEYALRMRDFTALDTRRVSLFKELLTLCAA